MGGTPVELEWSGPRVADWTLVFVAFGRDLVGGVTAGIALGAGAAAVIVVVVVLGLQGLRILLETASVAAFIIGFPGVVGLLLLASGMVGDP